MSSKCVSVKHKMSKSKNCSLIYSNLCLILRILINHKMLKYVSNSVSKPLVIIFNRSLREKIFPNLWKRNMVSPIFKKSERSNPCNYIDQSHSAVLWAK